MISGFRHGITCPYLKTDPRVNEDIRVYLMCEATEMHLKGEKERYIKDDGFEGIIHNTGKYAILGPGMGGVVFDVEGDTYDASNCKMSFLVNERTFGPSPSTN